MCFFHSSGLSRDWPSLLPLSPYTTPRSTGANYSRLDCLLCFPPTSGGCKPRIAFYVYCSFLSTISLQPRLFDRGDIMALDLVTLDGFFNPSMTKFTIIKSYSTKGRWNHTRSVTGDIVFPEAPQPTLILGDLNIHHPTSDPLKVFKEYEIATSTPYFDKVTELGYSHLNTPGKFTRVSMSSVGRPGVLDLAFACPLLAPYFPEWSYPLPSTGSDHIPILHRFKAPLFRAPLPSPNWALTDWPAVESSLKSTAISSCPPLPHHCVYGPVVQNEPGQGYGPACVTHPTEEGHLQVTTMVVRLTVIAQESIQLCTQLLEMGSIRCRTLGFRQGGPSCLFQSHKESQEGSLVLVLGLSYTPDRVDSEEVRSRPPASPFPGAPGDLDSAQTKQGAP